MGAYLSEPNVEKISEDGSIDRLSYGASAVQGWRVGMEDAHNCITKLEEDTSLFAVYDGHGGAEVAIYTAQELPKLLLSLEAFKNNDIGGALQEVFMKFDASLKQKVIVEKLRRIAGMEGAQEKEDDGETEQLLEEAELPLEQLVARYCSQPSKSKRAKLMQSHRNDLLSPLIKKKPPRFPLTAVNGTLQEGEGPVPNKTVPFDAEGDIVPQGKRERDGDENLDVMHGPDGDRKREGENGTDSDDDGGDEEEIKKDVKEEETEKMEEGPAEKGDGSKVAKEETEEAGSSGSSGSCNGDKHSETKDKESTSGTSSQLKQLAGPLLDDEDDSDEDDEDYQSEEEEGEGDDDDDEEEEEEEEEDDRGDYEEDEEGGYMDMPTSQEEPGSDSGSTAVVAVLKGREMIVANIGDSRCVLSRKGRALEMSYDHKPEDDIELRRIEKAGGKVTPDGRVNGGLNLSRAFGDHCYKQTTSLPPEEQMISAFPDIQTVTLTDEDEFMVVACDGIWNAMTSQEVIDFVQHRLGSPEESKQSNRLSKICEELFDFCLAPDTSGDGTGCDNMTCVIVQFHFDGVKKTVADAASVGSKRKSAEDDHNKEDTDSKKPRH